MTGVESLSAAGRALDELVTEQVIGSHFSVDNAGFPRSMAPHYSTDIAAAWSIVERLGADMGLYYHGGIPEYEVTFFGSRNGVAYVVTERGETAPLAICRAALKAVAP